MGVAQTFAGLSRVVAPILATAAFQRVGHHAPFFIAAGVVGMAGLLATRVEPVRMSTTTGEIPVATRE